MSTWPSIAWIERRSAPPSSKWLAKECRRAGGEAGCRGPARAAAGGPSAPRGSARRPAARVHEQPARVPLPRVRRANVAEIPCDPLHGLAAHGDETLLPSLACAHHVTRAQVDVVQREAQALGRPHPRRVEQLESCPIS